MNPKRVIIVGPNRGGWAAAAYLQAVLARMQGIPADISVVDYSRNMAPAKGEAGVPAVRQILAAVGIDETRFLNQASGTFRQATKYVNWLRGTGDFFYHPFDDARAQPIDRAALAWLASDRSVAFAETVSPQPVICDLGLAPRPLEYDPTAPALRYSYHADRDKLADLLRRAAIAGGVRHSDDSVEGVERSECGDIEAVITRSGARLQADLYIDCSGSDGVLIGEQPGAEWVDCSRGLPCDRVASLSVNYSEHYPGRLPPFTTATARSAGWIQEFPLQDCKIVRYVYSSRHIDDAAAERELRAFEGKHAEAINTQTVEIATGRRAAAWSGNCVALGAAGGCIEPLASANEFLRDFGIVALAEHFPLDDDFGPCAYRYNRIMANRYHELLDFVGLHYALSQRADTEFWRDARNRGRSNERLAAKLGFWKCKAPSPSDFVDQRFPGQPDPAIPAGGLPGDQRGPVDTAAMLGLESYECILYGMQFLADECDEWFGANRPPTRVPGYIIADLKRATALLPPHDVWLRQAAGMEDYSRGANR